MLIDSLDSASAWSTPSYGSVSVDAENKIQGTGALKLKGSGAFNETVIQTTKTLSTPLDPQNLGVISYYINNQSPRYGVGFTLSVGNSANVFNASLPNVNSFIPDRIGGFWKSFNVSEDPTIIKNGAITQLRLKATNNSAPFYSEISVDAIYGNVKGKPTVVFTWDDAHDTSYTFLLNAFSSRNMVATLAIPTAQIGQYQKLSWKQIKVIRDSGWAIALDGTPDDTSMTSQATVANAVAFFQKGQVDLIANGINDDAKNFMVYPFGASANLGVARINISALRGSNSKIVELDEAEDIPNGYGIYGAGIPPNTIVVTGGKTVKSLVLNNTIPVQKFPAVAINVADEFYYGKLPAALKLIGVKAGRLVGATDITTSLGIANPLEMDAYFLEGKSLAQVKAAIDKVLLRGSSIIFGGHRVVETPDGWTENTVNKKLCEAYINGLLDYIKIYSSNHQLDVLTFPQLYYRDINNNVP